MAMNTLEREHVSSLKMWNSRSCGNEQSEAEQLVIEHLRLVDFLVNHFIKTLPRFVNKEDLIGYGRIGLLDAAKKFQRKRGTQFETYAKWRIRGAIIDGLRCEDWLPRKKRKKIREIEETYRNLEQQKLRSVTDHEVCEYLEINLNELHQLMSDDHFGDFTSLDKTIFYDDDDEDFYSIVSSNDKRQPEKTLERKAVKQLVEEAINSCLNRKERLVIYYYFVEGLTLTEIGHITDLTPSRVSQIRAEAIDRLRMVLKNDIENPL